MYLSIPSIEACKTLKILFLFLLPEVIEKKELYVEEALNTD